MIIVPSTIAAPPAGEVMATLGPLPSGVTVKLALAVSPTPLVAVTVLLPLAVAPLGQV